MDARVNDFLSEIDEIAPLNDSKDTNVWEKCLDEDSGYYYYWNTITNEVTWDMPSGYKVQKSKPKKGLFIPPRFAAPLFPSACRLPPVSEAAKIYKIPQPTSVDAESSGLENQKIKSGNTEKKKIVSKPFPKNNDSDDEKIVLISSYGEDSETEDEETQQENGVDKSSKTENNGNVVLLQKNVKEASLIDDSIQEAKSKPISSAGISLLAGYGDSEEESDSESANDKNVTILPPLPNKPVSHSFLFPIVKPINVKDFEVSPETLETGEDFDARSFKRKRRIGVALMNTAKKVKDNNDDIERKGFGFDNDSSASSYSGFKSGGVMFLKADVLNPQTTDAEETVDKPQIIPGEIEDTYSTLKEKLGFLSEGREPVSPVQAMLIQVETLYAAVKTGDLRYSYLSNWLKETNSDLIKLENEAAPNGWLLEWDRSHKRYYYENEATGESQWEYPQADVTVRDEEMDICTTPPPNDVEPTIHMSPPMPPLICSPSPPPPPKISGFKPSKRKSCDIPLPPEPDDEPLPPGVDAVDVTSNKSKTTNNMSDALNSFYSDIAAIDTSNSPPAQQTNEDLKTDTPHDSQQHLAKKKKKAKVKLTQGIAMKKKGVSKLVEKWKNVNLSYD